MPKSYASSPCSVLLLKLLLNDALESLRVRGALTVRVLHEGRQARRQVLRLGRCGLRRLRDQLKVLRLGQGVAVRLAQGAVGVDLGGQLVRVQRSLSLLGFGSLDRGPWLDRLGGGQVALAEDLALDGTELARLLLGGAGGAGLLLNLGLGLGLLRSLRSLRSL